MRIIILALFMLIQSCTSEKVVKENNKNAIEWINTHKKPIVNRAKAAGGSFSKQKYLHFN